MSRYGYNIDQSPSSSPSAPASFLRRPISFSIDSCISSIADQTDYTVEIPGGYRDVISIELIKAVVPNPDSDNYLTLKIFGSDKMRGNTSTLEGAFCTLERDAATASPIVYKRANSDHNIAYTHWYDQPQKLGQLKITFLRPDGTAPDFGSNGHYLTFEINTLNQPRLPF